MRLGSDALKFPGSDTKSAIELLESAHDERLAGLFYRTMFQMSPTLDPGELRAIRERADEYDMYLESGIGLVNPYAIAEQPQIRKAGDGDTMLGFRRLIEAGASIGITELWAETAGFKPYPGRFHYDRFRTDVPWSEQLRATAEFLDRLAPIARDLGIHINLETHEEITSFELVRLVEHVGPDVLGITFDTANVVQRAEHPVWCAKRIAPYVRQTHIKDAGLFRCPEGLLNQMRPNGGGVVDLAEILPILFEHNPDLNLSMEILTPDPEGKPRTKVFRQIISLYDPEWVAGHPDLTIEELFAYLELVEQYAERIAAGEVEEHDSYALRTVTLEDQWRYLRDSLANVRSCAATAGIDLPVEGSAR